MYLLYCRVIMRIDQIFIFDCSSLLDCNDSYVKVSSDNDTLHRLLQSVIVVDYGTVRSTTRHP